MKTFTQSVVLTGALALVTPALSWADDKVGWYEGEDKLEQRLLPGKTPAAYREMLSDMGYTITSTNYDTPDYVEYEVVKGDRTYEVQIDVDDNTGNATNIDENDISLRRSATRSWLRPPWPMKWRSC